MQDKTTKAEVEELMNDLLPLAKKMLQEHGEFYPYGGYTELNGKITHVGAQIKGTDRPQSAPLIQLLRDSFKKGAKDGNYKATAIIFDVRIKTPGSIEKSDAIQVCLDHKSGYSAEVLFPYRIDGGTVTYGKTFAQQGSGDIFS